MKSKTILSFSVSIGCAMMAILLMPSGFFGLSNDERWVVLVAGLIILATLSVLAYFCGGVKGLDDCATALGLLTLLAIFAVLLLWGIQKDFGAQGSKLGAKYIPPAFAFVGLVLLAPENRYMIPGKLLWVFLAGTGLCGVAKFWGQL